MDKKTISFEFETSINWNPYDTGCWVDCPCAILVPLGEKCPAYKAHYEDNLNICPIAKNLTRKR